MTSEVPHEKQENRFKLKKRDRHHVSLSDKQIVLTKLDELEEEIQLIRASLNVGTEMAAASELAEKISEPTPVCPVNKNENIVDQEKMELLQKPDMQNIFKTTPICPVNNNENIVDQEKMELLQNTDMQNIFSKIEDFLLQ